MKRLALALLLGFAFIAPDAYAACTNPSGVAGEIVYNATYKVVQFCDDASWISMAAGTGTGVQDPRIGTLTASKWCTSDGTNINCASDAPAATAAGSTGQVQFNNGSNALAADAGLTWDNTNKRLGIGTASPQAKLEIDANPSVVSDGSTALRLKGLYGGALSMVDGGKQGTIWVQDGGTSLMFDVGTTVGSGARTGRLVLKDSGNVGIGTTAPVESLHVAGSIKFVGGRVEQSTGGYLDYSSNTLNIMANGPNAGTNASIKMQVSGSDGTGALTGLYINSSGNVGIGTASPTENLAVSSGSNTFVSINSPSGADSRVIFYEGGATRWSISSQGSTDNIIVSDSDWSNGAQMTQNQSGWSGFSDRRMKKNIKPFSVLDKLKKYQAVSFDWRSSDTHDLGVIAQDLFGIFPELVDRGDNDSSRIITKVNEQGIWAVHYDKLGALALEGVKELKAENDNLRALVEQQGKEIEALKAALH